MAPIEWHRTQWIFPDDRFVEYDESDEVWARGLGFGHEEEHVEVHDVETGTPVRTIVMHNCTMFVKDNWRSF